MRKVITAKEEFSHGKAFGFQEGRVRFDRVYSTIDQSNFGGTTAMTKFCLVRAEITIFDPATGDEIDNPEFQFIDIKVGDADKFHPGKITNANDEDVVDLGSELELEGNTIATIYGKGPDDKSKYALFTQSMEDAGFRSDVLRNTCFDDWAGFEADLATEELPPDFYGKPKPGATTPKNRPTRLIVVKGGHLVFPYDQKKVKVPVKVPAKTAAPTPKAVPTPKAAAPAPKPNGKPPAEASPSPMPDIISALSIKKADTEMPFAQFRRAVQSSLLNDYDKNPKELKDYLSQVDSPEWLAGALKEVGASFDTDTEIVTFAAAE